MNSREVPEIIVIGSSAGGLEALGTIVRNLKKGFQVPILIVQHMSPDSDNFLVKYLNDLSAIEVKEAADKDTIIPGTAYVAPPGYHLLLERNKTISLNTSAKVNFARPSVDVLFETAAWAYRSGIIAIVLTGANADGAAGARLIEDFGGKVIVQTPETAYISTMPESAYAACRNAQKMTLTEIASFLNDLK